MSEAHDLLVEIGTEELPPKALKRLSQAFTDGVVAGLAEAGLEHGDVHSYAAPRRLAVLVAHLASRQPDRLVERRGPALTAAFDDEGCPTKAALGFARSCGVEVENLERLETERGGWLAYRDQRTGKTSGELVPGIVQQALDRLPIPKRMRWADLTVQFVRPVHWVVMLYGDAVISGTILGVHAGRETRGHRFHHPQPIYLAEPAAYAPLLETEGRVLAAFDDRREAIRGQVMEAAAAVGGQAVIDEQLLDEVTSMVEWPVAIAGRFDERFLEVPAEALIAAMKGHQKYFHVVDDAGTLCPYFITVSNIDSRQPEQVRAGNERVIRPRLADADFFWSQDRKTPLNARRERLKSVVFEHKLGSLYDKTLRVAALAASVATALDGDPVAAERAAALCKCDLMTEMVGEFPELQGTMGRYYAEHDGESAPVAQAVEEHYLPRFAGDALPATAAGRAVAIADKLDTLVGIFGIGAAPTGDKDPFALRRAALGLVRILIESELELDLRALTESATAGYDKQEAGLLTDGAGEAVFDFVLGRLDGYYAAQGFRTDEIDAVLCLRPPVLLDIDRRLRALAAFRKLPEAHSLSGANKRISNILKKSEVAAPDTLDEALLREPAEQALAGQLSVLEETLRPLFEAGDYERAMEALAALRAPVDEFFDQVMVNVDDAAVRDNRLALLNRLRNLFLRAADISRLQTGGEG